MVEICLLKAKVGGSSPPGTSKEGAMDLKNIYDEVIKKYEAKARRYHSLNEAEQALVDLWRLNCQEREELTQQLLSLKWYEFSKEKVILKLSEQNNKNWNLLFTQLSALGILDKMRRENA